LCCHETDLISRHYSFECKAVAQERPYVSRPSRTQQLFNPKLVPKLTSDVPQYLLRKKGIADEQLAKKEQERGRKRERQDEGSESPSEPKRHRSVLSDSSDSISTISTNRSRSRSPRRTLLVDPPSNPRERKRRRDSISSAESYISDTGRDLKVARDTMESRSSRRRFSEISPADRGRRSTRLHSNEGRPPYSSEESRSRERIIRERRDNEHIRDYNGTRALSPKGSSHYNRGRRRSRSRSSFDRRNGSSESRSRSRNNAAMSHEGGRADARNSRTNPPMRYRERSLSRDKLRRRQYSDADDWYGARHNNGDNAAGGAKKMPKASRAPSKDRSLSPFSKRLALTQAMNMSR